MNENDAKSRILLELSSSEKLLWSGTPQYGLLLRPSDALLIPISLIWFGFAIFWKIGVPMSGKLFGIPFVCFGLYIVAGRFFVDARMRNRTVYALTNERVIIISGLFSDTIKSLSLNTLSDISISIKSNGTGTITFGPGMPYSWLANSNWPLNRQNAAPSFDGIPNARSVYNSIRQAQKSVNSPVEAAY